MFRAVRAALGAARNRFGFRLVHFSIQRDHLHLLVEANDRRSLSRGAQGLAIRVAKGVNRRLRRKGKVFADRYHARALRTPRFFPGAFLNVLFPVRTHHRRGSETPPGFVDDRSSAPWFSGWSRPKELCFGSAATRRAEAPVVEPRTWLLRVGFKRAGPIDLDDVPGGN
jgi:hypothetical protein